MPTDGSRQMTDMTIPGRSMDTMTIINLTVFEAICLQILDCLSRRG